MFSNVPVGLVEELMRDRDVTGIDVVDLTDERDVRRAVA
jgi:hypothetical protein